jgi:uncharacterized membrane protein
MEPFTKFIISMRPLQRMLLSVAFCIVVFFCLPKHQLSTLLIVILTWIAFAFCYTFMNVVILFKRSIEQIKKTAMADDGSAAYVLLMILVASFASVVMVLLLIISEKQQGYDNILFAVSAISGMLI